MLLNEIEDAIQALEAHPYPSDTEAVDWAGRIGHLISRLNTVKRGLMSEMTGPTRGEAYQIIETNAAERSYNSAAIIKAFADEGLSLPDLIRFDAVRLSWRWTELNRVARGKVDLRVTQREIDDTGDVEGPMIGEVWKRKQEIKGL